MTTKQAKRYFHWHARVLPNGRWQITYCNKTLDARTSNRLLEVFLQRYQEFLIQHESRFVVDAIVRQAMHQSHLNADMELMPYTKEELEDTPITFVTNQIAAPVARIVQRVTQRFVTR